MMILNLLFTIGSGFALQSFYSYLAKRISASIPNANQPAVGSLESTAQASNLFNQPQAPAIWSKATSRRQKFNQAGSYQPSQGKKSGTVLYKRLENQNRSLFPAPQGKRFPLNWQAKSSRPNLFELTTGKPESDIQAVRERF